MAQYNYYQRNAYVYGSAAPKEEYYRPERAERDARARERVAVQQKNRKVALRMDLPYLVALVVASAIALLLCVNYLRVQSQITTSMKNVEAYEKRLEELKTDNDALESRIEAGINLDEIYRVATEDLGMVYANKNQVITYDRTPTEYVRQNDDIAK